MPIGLFELLLIAGLALLVVPSQDIPKLCEKAGEATLVCRNWLHNMRVLLLEKPE